VVRSAEEELPSVDLVARRGDDGEYGVTTPESLGLPVQRDERGVWLLPPGSERGPFVIFLKAGGYTGGSFALQGDGVARLARGVPAKVRWLEYGVAPERPFPAALDDVLTEFRGLVDSGVDPRRIALVGASAGGGLAVSAAVALRDAGGPQPGAVAAWGPWTDLTHGSASLAENRDFDYCSAKMLALQGAAYVGAHDARDPRISPVFADLRELPPLFVQVGGAEMLRDDGVRLVHRARASGVDATLEVWPDMPHCWHFLQQLDDRGPRAIARTAAWLRARLGGVT
jgi:monoterpene epsilon-lactone hydrolase